MSDQETAEIAQDEAHVATPAAAPPELGTHGLAGSQAVHHPRPSAYVGIALILAFVTALEVGMFYVDDVDDWAVTTLLLVMMAVKFILVASWFMHLRFETPLFKRLFYGGLILAVAAYSVFLGASGVFPFID